MQDKDRNESKNILEVIDNIFSSKKIVALRNSVGEGLNEAWIYVSDEDNLKKCISANINLSEHYNREFLMYNKLTICKNGNLLYKKTNPPNYNQHFNETIIKNESKTEKETLANSLRNNSFIEGGFIFDQKKKTIKIHQGTEIKKITPKGLEECLMKYFAKPIIEYHNR